jgi:hypothetical protein
VEAADLAVHPVKLAVLKWSNLPAFASCYRSLGLSEEGNNSLLSCIPAQLHGGTCSCQNGRQCPPQRLRILAHSRAIRLNHRRLSERYEHAQSQRD